MNDEYLAKTVILAPFERPVTSGVCVEQGLRAKDWSAIFF